MLTDMLGREICVGSFVAYPGRQGSSLWQNVGEVVGIDKDYKAYSWSTKTGRLKVEVNQHSTKRRTVYIHCLDRVVVI